MSDIVSGNIMLPEVTVTEKNKSKLNLNIPKSNPPTPEIDKSSINNSLYKSETEKINGFYYDNQINNRLISVSLHPNTITNDGGITWDEVNSSEADDDGYRIKPLFSSLFLEDYQTAISNLWSNFGDDAIGNFLNQIKPYAPYLDEFTKDLEEMVKTQDQMKNNNDPAMKSKAVKILSGFVEKSAPILRKIYPLMNRGVKSKYGRFSYYSGTGVGFGNLSMKFTIFSDWIDNEFNTVDDQLKSLYPYCFGKFADFSDGSGNITGTEIGTSNLGIVGDIANSLFKWQLPPGGFESELSNIDKCQKGTLKLKFGAFYALDNLVISNAQFNFSRQMVKNWVSGENRNHFSPLSCEVTLSFKPASKFTDNKLRKFISGESMETEIYEVQNRLTTRLTEEKASNEQFLNGESH